MPDLAVRALEVAGDDHPDRCGTVTLDPSAVGALEQPLGRAVRLRSGCLSRIVARRNSATARRVGGRGSGVGACRANGSDAWARRASRERAIAGRIGGFAADKARGGEHADGDGRAKEHH
jgi:hypothetical protein